MVTPAGRARLSPSRFRASSLGSPGGSLSPEIALPAMGRARLSPSQQIIPMQARVFPHDTSTPPVCSPVRGAQGSTARTPTWHHSFPHVATEYPSAQAASETLEPRIDFGTKTSSTVPSSPKVHRRQRETRISEHGQALSHSARHATYPPPARLDEARDEHGRLPARSAGSLRTPSRIRQAGRGGPCCSYPVPDANVHEIRSAPRCPSFCRCGCMARREPRPPRSRRIRLRLGRSLALSQSVIQSPLAPIPHLFPTASRACRSRAQTHSNRAPIHVRVPVRFSPRP